MSTTLVTWLKIVHVVGVITWIGGLVGVLSLLRAHASTVDAAARQVLGRIELQVARVMDLGATLAIGAGLYQALASTPNAFKTGGWLHAKLTLVVITVFAMHGYARAKVKRFGKGEVKPIPAWIIPALLVGVVVIVILAVNKEILRK